MACERRAPRNCQGDTSRPDAAALAEIAGRLQMPPEIFAGWIVALNEHIKKNPSAVVEAFDRAKAKITAERRKFVN